MDVCVRDRRRRLLDALPDVKRKIFFLFLFLTAAALPLWACPVCSEIVQRGRDVLGAMRFGKGIYYSLSVMLGVPAILVSSMIIFVYHASKRQEKNRG